MSLNTVRHSALGTNCSVRFAAIAVMMVLFLAPASAWAQPVEWIQRAVSGPSPRYWHQMAYDSARNKTVLFGGQTASGAASGQTWEWNGTAWTQPMVSGPSSRYAYAMAYDSGRSVTILFGGYTGNYNGETWEWNGTVWTRRTVSGGPTPRTFAMMAYDSARGVTVLFGGRTSNGVANGETWVWNGTEWNQRAVPGPSPRLASAMGYDSARGTAVLFGGTDGIDSRLGDTWEWNGTAWTQRIVSGPSARAGPVIAYDAARGVTVLFGGNTDVIGNDETWEWNGITWVQRIVSGPSERNSHAMAYDVFRGVTVLFGGLTDQDTTINDETWELAPCIHFSTQPMAQTVCGGGSAVFAVAASGSGTLSFQWRKNGAAIGDRQGHIAGTMTSVLSIMDVSIADEGQYDCIVTNAICSNISRSAPLRAPPADFNRDGIINSQDFFDFLAAFFAGCP